MSDLVEHLRWKGHQQGDSQLLEAATQLERMRPVVNAALSERRRHEVLRDGRCPCQLCSAVRALDGEP